MVFKGKSCCKEIYTRKVWLCFILIFFITSCSSDKIRSISQGRSGARQALHTANGSALQSEQKDQFSKQITVPNQSLEPVSIANIHFIDALTIGLNRHPEIHGARISVIRSQEQIAVERSIWYPELHYNVQPGYQHEKDRGRDKHTMPVVQTSVGASQLLYDFGNTPGRVAAAHGSHRKNQFILANMIENGAHNIAKIFIELALAQEFIQTAEGEYQAMKKMREKISQRVAAGLSDAVDINMADVSVQRASFNLLSAKTRYQVASEQFIAISGIRPIKVQRLDEIFQMVSNSNSLAQNTTNIENSATLLAAKTEIGIAEMKLRISQSQYYPTLSFSIKQNNTFANKNQNSNNRFIGFHLNGSFNSGLKEYHQVKAAKADIEIARQLYENERLAVTTSFHSAREEAKGAYERIDYSKKIIQLSEVSQDLLWQQYTLNKRSLTDVMNAERDRFMAENDHKKAMADYILALIQSQVAAGNFVTQMHKYGLKIPSFNK